MEIEVERKKRIEKKVYISLRNVVVFLALLGAGLCTAQYYSVKSQRYEEELLKKALVKADTNKDGILQNQELADLLRTIGDGYIIPDNRDIGIGVGNNTYVSIDGISTRTRVSFGRSDLEKYLGQE